MSEQTKNVRSLLGSQPERKGFPRRGEEGPPPSPPQPRREETRSQPFFRARFSAAGIKNF